MMLMKAAYTYQVVIDENSSVRKAIVCIATRPTLMTLGSTDATPYMAVSLKKVLKVLKLRLYMMIRFKAKGFC